MAILARELLVVVRINVAIAAHARYTLSRMRKPEEGVVEGRTQPCLGDPSGVAGDAARPIIRRDVIRHAGVVSLRVRVISLVAAVTIGSRIARSVVAADMAVRARIHHRPNCAGDGRAWRQHVRTLQREPSCGMVELSVRPKHRVVTCRTH